MGCTITFAFRRRELSFKHGWSWLPSGGQSAIGHEVYNQTWPLGHDRLFRPASIARRRSMPQRTYLIAFQTYHTVEPRRSTYAQLAPYNMRKSPLFTKHVGRLMSEHEYFCVAQATLGLLRLTQLGKVDCWSF